MRQPRITGGNFAYNYTPYVKPFRPFEKLKKNNGYTKYIKQFGLNYVPSNISFQTAMMRNYYEIKLRDLTSSTDGGNQLLSFSPQFLVGPCLQFALGLYE